MAKNPLIRKIPLKKKLINENKSAGILDDFAIRKTVATKEGTIEKVPVNDSDIVNKAYVDSQLHLPVKLNEVENPDGNKSFTMSNKLLAFRYTAPTPADDFAGAFEIEGAGGFSGNLVHIHQHTGNPGAVTLLDLEADDVDVVPLEIKGVGTYDIITDKGINVGGDIAVTGTVDGVDIAARDHAKYTDAEVDAIVLTHKNIATAHQDAPALILTHKGDASAHHTKYTDAEVDTIVATHTALTDAHHSESHTIVSHSDTTATGAELDTLTDNSIANTLHRHSELVASDGSPDPALSVDATGKVGIGTTSPIFKFHVNGIASFSTVDFDNVNTGGTISIFQNSADYGTIWSQKDGNSAWGDIALAPLGGNVGIGTTSPNVPLEVNGIITATAGGAENTEQEVYRIGRPGYPTTYYHSIFASMGSGASTDHRLQFKMNDGTTTGQNTIMTLRGDGNVGIGTTTPNAKLDVTGTIKIKEQAAADGDTAAKGQLWVKNTTPCQLWFTDDTGTDTQIV